MPHSDNDISSTVLPVAPQEVAEDATDAEHWQRSQEIEAWVELAAKQRWIENGRPSSSFQGIQGRRFPRYDNLVNAKIRILCEEKDALSNRRLGLLLLSLVVVIAF